MGRQAPGLLCSVTSAHCGEGLQTHDFNFLYQSHGTEQVPGTKKHCGDTWLHTALVSIGLAGDRFTEADGWKSPRHQKHGDFFCGCRADRTKR